MQKLPKADVTAKVERAAGLLHIEPLLRALSRPAVRRAAPARRGRAGAAMEPAVLLMDEPLSNLDALLRLELRAELKGVLQEAGPPRLRDP